MNDLLKIIEAMIFSSESAISLVELQTVLFTYSGEEISIEAIQEYVNTLELKYEDDSFIFEIVKSGGGYQFLSKPAFHKPISALLQQRAKRKLSTAALECLSIIAYSQPVTKNDIEQIRGVNCDYTIQKLMERDLVKITGRAEQPGKPLLYGTSQYFMDYFGINSIEELPKLKEFEKEMAIGDPGDIMVNVDEHQNHTLSLKVKKDERRDDTQNENDEKNNEENKPQENNIGEDSSGENHSEGSASEEQA
ncbi:MAG TPA: SMC-Scp complex subunit ScpB [Chitinophagales bacterium]|nr:SMC-Scp complex subunit ScpB [Chitinophagales bacterium]